MSTMNRASERNSVTGRTSQSARTTFRALVMVLSAGAALVASGLLLILAGSNPVDVFVSMVRGSLGSKPSLVSTLNHAAPIMLVATGVVIAGRANLLNIGQEGQITMGGLAGVAVGLYLPGPGWVVLIAVLIAGMLGGGLWAGVAGIMKYKRGVSEVISSLLLIVVAAQIASFAVNRTWLLGEEMADKYVTALPRTNLLEPDSHMPLLVEGSGFRLHAGIVIAVAGALVVRRVLDSTRWGFHLRMTGLNETAAKAQGVATAAHGATALILSGAFAGLCGGVLLTGTSFRLLDGFSSGYGWEGLLAAFVGNLNPLLIIPSSLMFGALRAGGGVLSATGVSPTIVGVVQGLVVIAIVVPAAVFRTIDRRAAVSLKAERT